MTGRVFGYIRTSTKMQRTVDQEHMINKWCNKNHLALDRLFIDKGVSGAVPFAERQAGRRLWGTLLRGDVLVAGWLDRLFRVTGDCLAVTEALRQRGVSLFISDFPDDVSADGISKLVMQITATFAEHERLRSAERIRASKRRKKENGEFIGGRPPFGYVFSGSNGDKFRSLIPVPEQQDVIRRVRQWANEGYTAREISDHLREINEYLSHVTVRKIVGPRVVLPALAIKKAPARGPEGRIILRRETTSRASLGSSAEAGSLQLRLALPGSSDYD